MAYQYKQLTGLASTNKSVSWLYKLLAIKSTALRVLQRQRHIKLINSHDLNLLSQLLANCMFPEESDEDRISTKFQVWLRQLRQKQLIPKRKNVEEKPKRANVEEKPKRENVKEKLKRANMEEKPKREDVEKLKRANVKEKPEREIVEEKIKLDKFMTQLYLYMTKEWKEKMRTESIRATLGEVRRTRCGHRPTFFERYAEYRVDE